MGSIRSGMEMNVSVEKIACLAVAYAGLVQQGL